MTPEQEVHLQTIKDHFNKLVDKKYRSGQAEHGGNLWERDTLHDLTPEIVDAFTYLHCEVVKRRWIMELLVRLKSDFVFGKDLKPTINELLKFHHLPPIDDPHIP